MKLRGGTAELRIETGSWYGLSRNEQVCKNCDAEEVEDVEHFLLCCVCMVEERRLMEETVAGWHKMEVKEKVVVR